MSNDALKGTRYSRVFSRKSIGGRDQISPSPLTHPLTTMLGLAEGVLVNDGLKPSSSPSLPCPKGGKCPMTWHHSCLLRMGTSQRAERAYKMWGTGGSSLLSPFLRFLQSSLQEWYSYYLTTPVANYLITPTPILPEPNITLLIAVWWDTKGRAVQEAPVGGQSRRAGPQVPIY